MFDEEEDAEQELLKQRVTHRPIKVHVYIPAKLKVEASSKEH
jgi:hypothetical protein